MTAIGVILGSTRPGRPGESVADLVDHPLPHLDEPLPPSM